MADGGKKLLLPKIKQDCNIKIPSKEGVWTTYSKAALDNLSVGLDISDEIAELDSEVFSSVPSPWAVPIFFGMTLLGQGSNQERRFDRVLGEWRGLLALLALKDWLDLPITVTQVDFQATTKNTIRDILGASPRKSLFKWGWEKINVIRFDGRPIGLTSPLTIVCTAADYVNAIPSNIVKWFNSKRLVNPKEHLSTQELMALNVWLINLESRLKDFFLDDSELKVQKERLSDVLHAFITDIQAEIDRSQARLGVQGKDEKIGIKNITFQGTGIGLGLPWTSIIPNPVCLGEDGGVVSDKCVIAINQSRTVGPARKWVMFDPHIAEQWGKMPKDVVISGDLTLGSSIELVRKRLESGTDNTVRVVTVDDILLPKAIVIDKGFFPGQINFQGCNGLQDQNGKFNWAILPPIKKDLLNILTVEDIANRISVNSTGKEVIVRLRLELGPEKKAFIVEKTYKFGDNLEQLSELPIIETWPFLKRDNWHSYYLYTAYPTPRRGTFEAIKALGGDEISKDAVKLRIEDENSSEFVALRNFPEALICQRAGRDVGLVLLRQPPQFNPIRGKIWKVAVDFGTENTTVIVRAGETGEAKTPQPLVPRDLLLTVTSSGTIDHILQEYLYSQFQPAEISAPSVRSVYNTFGERFKEIFLDGHIYFMDPLQMMTIQKVSGDLKINLKWSMLPNDRSTLQLFLRELGIHILALAARERVESVLWHFAYPTAFTDEEEADYRNYWTSITRWLIDETGINVVLQEPMTESVAAAKFFKRTEQGLVSLDIGGATTDVSIWKDGNLQAQTSILFAGQEIFIDPIYRDKDRTTILKAFVDQKPELFKLITDNKTDSNKVAIILSNFLDQLLAELHVISGDEEVRRFLRTVQFGVNGLVFYVGLLLKQVDIGNTPLLSVRFAGNGSKIIQWLTNKNVKESGEITTTPFGKSVEKLLRQVGGITKETMIDVGLTTHPKEEVAQGVLDSTSLEAKKFLRSLAGEDFSVKGTEGKHSYAEELSASYFKDGILIKELSNFKSFVEAYNNVVSQNLQIHLTENDYRRLCGNVLGALGEYTGMDMKKIRIEPIFILALREFKRSFLRLAI